MTLDEITPYFTEPNTLPAKNPAVDSIANYIKPFEQLTPAEITDGVVAIIGIDEGRNAVGWHKYDGVADEVRKHLFALKRGNFMPRVTDLGNITLGATPTDTYALLGYVCAALIRNGITPFIIGGSNDLMYAQYLAYAKLEETVNMVAVDSMFDLGTINDPMNAQTHLGKIITASPNFLFNFSNLAYQTYLVEQQQVELMGKMYFDVHRLGLLRNNLNNVEPITRGANTLSFDMSAVRAADARATGNPTPNGLYAEEACTIMRFAGLSDKLTCAAIFELTDEPDGGLTAHLAAQMLWFFIEGHAIRTIEVPNPADKVNYIVYNVTVKDASQHITFYKSNRTGKWWMDVPYSATKSNRYEKHHFVPCSYDDYKTALENEVPDRWWQTYQKML